MMQVNWKQDYSKDFTCYKCQQAKFNLAGLNHRGKQQLRCPKCNSVTQLAIKINQRSRFLDSRLVDSIVDWRQDYSGELICPECQAQGMRVRKIGNYTKKRRFYCPNCRHTCPESCEINIKPVEDPLNPGLIWYTDHRYQDFLCPRCEAQDIFYQRIQYGKKAFFCHACQKKTQDCLDLTNKVLKRYSKSELVSKPFDFNEDKWDLRAINPNFNPLNTARAEVNFKSITLIWFKQKVKKYIHFLSKTKSFKTIQTSLSSLRIFGHYLEKKKLTSFCEINRSVILDYLSQEKIINKAKLGALRDFFYIGTARAWFTFDQDIIRSEDYPKQHKTNPEPLSDIVREQIEQNLHKLPDPIARMWMICYFAAMRPSELALLKQNCLVQSGQHWKLVWQRKKSHDYHEIPISRTIAKVVQEQIDYIQNLWDEDWNYLFCHYQGLSKESLSKIKLQPIKKIVSNSSNNALLVCVNTLIKELNICDENGKLANFKIKVLRTTRATNLFEEGHELAVVSAWLGHKHFATTSTYYTKVSCDLIEQEAGHIQKALVNSEGCHILYESFPKSFWEKPQAHKLELSGTHINTPIYGYCGLDLDQDCHKFRACYTCCNFVATAEKLPQYIKTRDELRGKQSQTLASGQDVLVEQFGTQAEQLDKIIASLQEVA